MLADEKAQAAGAPTRDVTAVGAAPAAEPRTETLDWVFVGYLPRVRTRAGGARPEAVWVEDEAELARAAAVLLGRDQGADTYPYLLVRPGLLSALEDAFVPLALGAARGGYLGDAPRFSADVWDVEVDFAAYERSQAMSQAAWVPNPDGTGRYRDKEWEAAEREAQAALRQAVGEGAWDLCDEMACDSRRFPLRRGTMRQIMEDSLRRELRSRLYRSGDGWQIVLAADGGRLITPDGRELVPYTPPAPGHRPEAAPVVQSLEELAFAWVQANPGTTGDGVHNGLRSQRKGRQKTDVLAALKALESAGRIENRGTERARAWHVTDAPAF